MKKIFTILLFFLLFESPAFSVNYAELYYNAELYNSSFLHDIDPYQDQDYVTYAYSPYPLFRTSSTLYFKNITIEPGYYTITPRHLGDKDYILFKDCGKVRHIIPVAQKTTTSPMFYQTQVPAPQLSKTQKAKKKFWDRFYSIAKDSKKVPPPKSFIDVKDNGRYFLINYYFADDCYLMIFKRQKY